MWDGQARGKPEEPDTWEEGILGKYVVQRMGRGQVKCAQLKPVVS